MTPDLLCVTLRILDVHQNLTKPRLYSLNYKLSWF